MTQPMPHMNLAGAVDLSTLAGPPAGAAAGAPPTGTPGPGGADAAPGGAGPVRGPYVVDTGEADFGDVVQRSASVPVVLALLSARSAASTQLSATLEALAREFGGRFQLARVDADANAQIAGALQVQAVPTVVALIGGQPVPLFQGAYPEDQLRPVLEEVLRLAAQHGVTGTVTGEADEVPEEPAEPPVPPLHAEARAAIDRGDLAAAEDAYTRALKENPADREAHAARLQVRLIRRVERQDPDAVLAAAQERPEDLEAQLDAADVEAATGRLGAAFDRLLTLVTRTADPDRERLRVRLVELFDIAGPTHPDVAPARRRLASALY